VKPDYYVNSKEHVMTHAVFSSMSIHKVGTLIGGLSRDKRSKGKKARKGEASSTP